VLWTCISEAGLKLLWEMDPVTLAAPKELLARLNPAELTELIRLLELARGGCSEPQTKRWEPSDALP
jgi:hypothetical protein